MAFVPPARHLLRARDLADARYFDETLDVEAMASAAGLSRAHFSREFRRAFGEPPRSYLLTRRLERAAALLTNTRPLRRRRLLLGRPAQRRLLHHDLHAHLRDVTDRLPCRLPAGRRPRARAGVRAARPCAPATPHVSRRQGAAAAIAWLRTFRPTEENEHDRHLARPAVGARPGRGACLLHAEARHGGQGRRDHARDGRL